MIKAIGTRNIFSATSVDQLPKQISCALMFGSGLSIPIPDIDRTDYMLILGANPLASNGSLMTAPDFRGRLQGDPRPRRPGRRRSTRGGPGPRRSPTSTIRSGPAATPTSSPGIVHTMIDEDLVDLDGDWSEHVAGARATSARRSRRSPPRPSRAACGIAAAEIRRIAREICAAPTAAVYARIGTTTQEFGTLASWLVDVINAITGNLDRPGGAMFPLAAAGQTNSTGAPGRGPRLRDGPLELARSRAARGIRRAARRPASPRRSPNPARDGSAR